jgi:hypothetical protein
MYLAITGLCIFLATFPDRWLSPAVGSILGLLLLLLWLVGAFTLRREVVEYYATQEAATLRLNPVLTALFGPWYVGGHLRADFPLDHEGKTGSGVLKLV